MNHKTIWLHYGNGIDEWEAFCNPRDSQTLSFRLNEELQKRGFTTKLTATGYELGDFFALISFDIHEDFLRNIRTYPKERCYLYVQEPPPICPLFFSQRIRDMFGKIFMPFDEYVDGIQTIKVHFQQPRFLMHRIDKSAAIPFQDKKFCCMINSNKNFLGDPRELYTERKRTVDFFSTQAKGFDLYGHGWYGFSAWQGPVPPYKIATLKNYKFSICYENTRDLRGNITERLFNCLCAQCIPVYLGAPDITDYVPKECFIDRRQFVDNQELLAYLQSIDQATYQKMVDIGQNYLDHDQRYNLFTNENIIDKTLYCLDTLQN